MTLFLTKRSEKWEQQKVFGRKKIIEVVLQLK